MPLAQQSTHSHASGSTRASYAVAVIECLQQQGLDPNQVLGATRVGGILQGRSDDRIALAEWLDIIDSACRFTGNPLFTLKVAEAIRLRHIGVLGFLLSTCGNLAQAGQILLRYEPLLDGVNTVDLHITERACTLVWLPLIDHPPPSLAMLAMAIWAHQIRWLTDRPDLTFGADFTFAPPTRAEDLRALQATFGGPLKFNAPRSALIASRAALDLPIAQRDPVVHNLLKQRADAELESLSSTIPGLPQDIEALLMRELLKGDATLPHISQLLGMPPRTLQSRLTCAGLNYRDLIERVRLKLALQHLSDHQTPLIQIANLLGYANQTGFQSAFKKWTGLTPGEFRRQQYAITQN
ncbi:MAG: AraC family transcriptional regulator [Aquabacterium sp.]|uniref:AraC family transcriptional regulator n=1 Tax=Aquabacterium sp. TaxID=1872578 RepID=UPI0025C3D67D|nr:AraC family transcriptional regulator [Aquabacterium sp.]MBI5924731.1 AraC family transcriptional regulator [Aquabacterium sp.]